VKAFILALFFLKVLSLNSYSSLVPKFLAYLATNWMYSRSSAPIGVKRAVDSEAMLEVSAKTAATAATPTIASLYTNSFLIINIIINHVVSTYLYCLKISAYSHLKS
jgi:hypothetical protein